MKSKKFTLYISEEVISKAKAYAKEQGMSVSGLVEDFLSSKTEGYDASGVSEASEDPDFADFYGVIDLPEDTDEKELLRSIKEAKHR